MKYLLAVLLASWCLVGSAADFKVNAPAKIEHAPGRLIEVTSEGAEVVKYDVIILPAGALEVRQSGTTLLMGMPAPGTTIIVIAAAVVESKLQLVRTAITVEGPVAPAPGGQKAASAAKDATYVYDSLTTKAPDRAALNTVAAAVGTRLHLLDLRTTDPAARQVLDYFSVFYRNAKGPVLVLQDGSGEVIGTQPAATLTAEGLSTALSVR